MAHIQLRHADALIQNQRLVSGLSEQAARAADIASRNASPAERAVLFREEVTLAIDGLLYNGYAQSQEFQADAEAAVLLRSAGYDPSALISMLRILERLQPQRPGGFNKTHPSPALRIASLSQSSLNGRGRDTRSFRDSRFTPIK
jgi:predicted Zn-dependent protease